MDTELSQNILSEIHQMVVRVRHDLKKPEATARMFMDLLDDIKDQPEQVSKWKANLISSFQCPLTRLDEFEELVNKYLGRYR
ncbi:MAG TPA: hypothetical protein VI895_07985 [Bdellovibrionota bacterium]|nr:hypothetical protein [Bdellovibrionota bacterium]